MAKAKFTLTKDLIRVEPEPVSYENEPQVQKVNTPAPVLEEAKREPISLKIPKQLKQDFQIWCVNNDLNMTEGLELALSRLIQSHIL